MTLPFLLLLCCFCCLTATAQDGPQTSERLPLLTRVRLKIDRMALKGIDTAYVELPRYPWRVALKSRVAQTDMIMKAKVDADEVFGEGTEGKIEWKSKTRTPVTASAGIWVGYRGIGIGVQQNIGRRKGTQLALGLAGSRFHFYARYARHRMDEMDISVKGNADGMTLDTHIKDRLECPIKAHTLTAEAYYFFNGRRYSHNAAYKQAVVQKRSAGSLLAGLLAFRTDIDYADPRNAPLVRMMDNIGRLEITQLSLGVGYTYNWVPAKGWLLNALVIPMVTVVNTATQHHYLTDDGAWQKAGKHTAHHPVDYNIDGRLSLTRNWARCFVSAAAKLNHYYYKNGHTSGQTLDWYTNLSIGYRF